MVDVKCKAFWNQTKWHKQNWVSKFIYTDAQMPPFILNPGDASACTEHPNRSVCY